MATRWVEITHTKTGMTARVPEAAAKGFQDEGWKATTKPTEPTTDPMAEPADTKRK